MSVVRASQQTLANIEQYQLCCKKSAESNARAHNHSRCLCVHVFLLQSDFYMSPKIHENL